MRLSKLHLLKVNINETHLYHHLLQCLHQWLHLLAQQSLVEDQVQVMQVVILGMKEQYGCARYVLNKGKCGRNQEPGFSKLVSLKSINKKWFTWMWWQVWLLWYDIFLLINPILHVLWKNVVTWGMVLKSPLWISALWFSEIN